MIASSIKCLESPATEPGSEETAMTTSIQPTRTVDGAPVPQPGTFVLDSTHTTVGFVARHLMVSKVRGSFGQVSGEITIGENPLDSTVRARIAAASIDTGQPDRDQHLRGADFLDAERFPELIFTTRPRHPPWAQ